MWHVRKTGEVNTGFWWGDMRERGRLEDLGVDGRIILKSFSKKWMEALIRIGKGGGLL